MVGTSNQSWNGHWTASNFQLYGVHQEQSVNKRNKPNDEPKHRRITVFSDRRKNPHLWLGFLKLGMYIVMGLVMGYITDLSSWCFVIFSDVPGLDAKWA